MEISHFLREKHGLRGKEMKRWSVEKAVSISNHPSLTEKKADDVADTYLQALAYSATIFKESKHEVSPITTT